jgi:hypothetical protein
VSSSSRFISEQRFVFQSMQQHQQPIEVINPLDDVASDGFVIHLDHHPLPPLPPRPIPTATATPTTTLVATIEPKKPFNLHESFRCSRCNQTDAVSYSHLRNSKLFNLLIHARNVLWKQGSIYNRV